jgi:hypothetical protein
MSINLQAKTNRLGRSDAKPALPIWFAGVAARTLFLIVLTIITARVASPQIERLSSVYGTPSDLVRVLVGVGVCAWLIINLFILPKDSGTYRTWMYLGLGGHSAVDAVRRRRLVRSRIAGLVASRVT